MKNLPITAALFTTTKGHFGNDQIYKSTVEDFDKKFPNITNRIAHIKVCEKERGKEDDMKSFLGKYGFKCFVSYADWKHSDVSHYIEHAKDIIKILNLKEVHSMPYMLWLEDDFIFEGKEISEEGAIRDSIKLLEEDKDIVSVRFPRNSEVQKKLNCLEYNDKTKVYPWGFTFNPNVSRVRDLYLASIIMEENYLQQARHFHIEAFFSKAIENISKSENPYICWNYEVIQNRHIGVENFDPQKIKEYE